MDALRAPPPSISSSSSSGRRNSLLFRRGNNRKSVLPSSRRCLWTKSKSGGAEAAVKSEEYQPGFLDELFLEVFRRKMVQEVGWESKKPGYEGLMEVVNYLMTSGRSNKGIEQSSVRILRSLFPPFLLDLYRILVAPIAGGTVAALMIARVTAFACQWLMGRCTVNFIQLSDGSSCESGVLVEKCKYLEESKCVSTCIHSCKLPTQTFIKEYMGVSLTMEPDFNDFSCQFKFGVPPPHPEDDPILRQSCLEICPRAIFRQKAIQHVEPAKCPKV